MGRPTESGGPTMTDPIIDTDAFDFGSLRSDAGELFTDVDEPQSPPEDFDSPDASVLGRPKPPRGALAYQKKARSLVSLATKLTLGNPRTLPDSAALVMYGPDLADKAGLLAVHDANFARAIDMLTEGAENPYLAMTMAAAPLVFQLIRNHEPIMEPQSRGLPLPFLKDAGGQPRRLRIKFGVKLGMFRNLTHAPDLLTTHVFNDPNIQAALIAQGVNLDTLFRKPEPRRSRRSWRSQPEQEQA